MTYADFFKEHGHKYLNPFSMEGLDPNNREINYTGTIEELYQAFSDRFAEELATVLNKFSEDMKNDA